MLRIVAEARREQLPNPEHPTTPSRLTREGRIIIAGANLLAPPGARLLGRLNDDQAPELSPFRGAIRGLSLF